MKKLAIYIAVLLLFPLTVNAGNYFSLNAGQYKPYISSGAFRGIDETNTSTKTVKGFGYGYRFNGVLALEGNYYDMGEFSWRAQLHNAESKLKVELLAASTLVSIGNFYGRGGLAYAMTDGQVEASKQSNVEKGSHSSNKLVPFYGVGYRRNINKHLTGGIEYTSYQNVGIEKINLQSDINYLGVSLLLGW
ncbi:MAG: outer membrane beta-barrel protein [Candidatus Omnitrophica bacterium]|nr:outer membrane beta-barrel protein [Candidatus Omnitrophota bacterium]